jgi:hypothetical protein
VDRVASLDSPSLYTYAATANKSRRRSAIDA